MNLGPFKIKISTTAVRLSLDNLLPEERDILCAKTQFDPNTHDVYRFSVIPEFSMTEERHGLFGLWPRKIKKESFSKADNVIIQIRVGSPEIRLSGIHPVTMTVGGKASFEYEGESLLEIGIPGTGKLKLGGKVKNNLKREDYSVFASSTDDLAQWVFLKSWLETDPAFRLEILCSVPKGLNQDSRFIICDVKVAEGSRVIKRAKKKRVLLTVTSSHGT